MFSILKIQMVSALLAMLLLSACEKAPADYRSAVSLPIYSAGDADNGALIYAEACAQCHQLTAGLNKKGPQLMNIYGAPAADLDDYAYSEALTASGWVWDAKTLDPYIADTAKAMSGSKMLADPMPDASERADVIAYLSTLRAGAPSEQAAVSPDMQMSNEPVEVLEGDAHKPAAF